MFIFVTCDVSPFAGFTWFLARALLKLTVIEVESFKSMLVSIVVTRHNL